MEVSTAIDTIEEALSIPDTDTARSGDAAAFLNDWFQEPTLLCDCAFILNRSESPNCRFKSANLFSREVETKWAFYSDEAKNEIRGIFLSQCTNLNDDERTTNSISDSIGKIAVFDALHLWNDIMDLFTQPEDCPIEVLKGALVLLDGFTKHIFQSQSVTKSRKIELRETCLQFQAPILELIRHGLSEEPTAPIALSCLNNFLVFCQLFDVINDDVMRDISINYMQNPRLQPKAIEVLETILLNRSDTIISFTKFSPIVAYALWSGKDPNNPSLPITNSEAVAKFLVMFLIGFVEIIALVFVPPDQMGDRTWIDEAEGMVDDVTSVLSTFNVTLDQFRDIVLDLYSVALSIPESIVDNYFWALWDNIFRRIQFEVHYSTREVVSVFNNFFEPMYPNLRQRLYELIPLSADEEGVINYRAKSCLSALAKIQPQEMQEFLNEQETTSNLVYTLMCVGDALDDGDAVAQQVIDLIDEISAETDNSIVLALVYAVSTDGMQTRLLSSNRETLSKVLDFLLQMIDDGEGPIPGAASRSLFRLVQPQIAAFTAQDGELVNDIIDRASSFVMLDRESTVRLFKMCARLLGYDDNLERAADRLSGLIQPVIESLSEFYNSPDENIEKGIISLNIILEIAYELNSLVPTYYDVVMPLIMDLAPNIINDSPQYANVAEYLLAAAAALISVSKWEVSSEHFAALLEMCQGSQMLNGPVFQFIMVARAQHQPVADMYESIASTFIQPAMALEAPPVGDICRMASEFADKLYGSSEVELVYQALESLNPDDNRAGIGLWESIIMFSPTEEGAAFYNETRSDLIRIVLTALTDRMHQGSFDHFANFLRFVISKAMQLQVTAQLQEEIVQTLAGIQPETRPGLYQEFASFITSLRVPLWKISNALSTLLANMRCVEPIDVNAFEIKQPHFFAIWPFGIFDYTAEMPHEVRQISPGIFQTFHRLRDPVEKAVEKELQQEAQAAEQDQDVVCNAV